MYRAPVGDILWSLHHAAGFADARAAGAFASVDDALIEAVLGEAGRFATERLDPLNRIGDREGCRIGNGQVATPTGWAEAYRDWCEAGWNGLAAPEAFGGQALPFAFAAAVGEMWNGANMAFALCPMLTAGAIEALDRHGSEALKALYLPRIVSGEWTATMNLTEPQAGSDVGALAARAEPQADGSYRLFGQKIYITYGEHDLAENIVHLVLARLPDAPAGSRGVSLFLAPKFLPDAEGRPGARNDLFAAGIETKLGIHGSPTCTMIYGDGRSDPDGSGKAGASAWLVGEPNRGLAAMFTMMNNARLTVGVQGVGQAERATQAALAYAAERRQGRAWGAADESSPIADHPDVRRMLLTMQALTEMGRAICLASALAGDLGREAAARGEASAASWQARAELLTPIAKAFGTDIGVEVASLAVQVHGGAGYVEETGVAQILRDARIAPIYEGTNGIQAVDLVTRKLPQADGAAMAALIAELQSIARAVTGGNGAFSPCGEGPGEGDGPRAETRGFPPTPTLPRKGGGRAPGRSELGASGGRLAAALDDLRAATDFLLSGLADGRVDEALAGASDYLRLGALTAGSALLLRSALAGGDDPASHRRAALARFAAERLLPQTAALRAAIVDGSGSVLTTDFATNGDPRT